MGRFERILLFGRPDASEADIWNALKTANADGFVSPIASSLDSGVGRAGYSPERPEKSQRISIA